MLESNSIAGATDGDFVGIIESEKQTAFYKKYQFSRIEQKNGPPMKMKSYIYLKIDHL